MSHGFHPHPNHREASSFREERYYVSNHNRAPHHNCAEFREEDDYYYASKVEAPVRYETEVYCGETVYGRPRYGNNYEDKVVDYEFAETVKEAVVLDECGERKHHVHFNRFKAL